MSYIHLSNRFWKISTFQGVTASESLIYYRLLDLYNHSGWKNGFSISNSVLLGPLALSQKTLIVVREKLVKKGLIAYKKGSRFKEAPVYYFPELIDNQWVFPDIPSTESDPQHISTSESKPSTDHETNPIFCDKVTVEIPSQPVPDGYSQKTETVETSQKTETVEASQKTETVEASQKTETVETSRSATGETPQSTTGKTSRPAPRNSPRSAPTLEEVETYFESQGADKRLDDWRESARRFYDHFSAVDWRDKYNRRITCWENRANSWIFDDEKRQKEILKNGNDREDPNKSPDSGNRYERKSYPGTFNGYPGGTLPPEAYTDPDWFRYNGNGIPFKGKFQNFCGLKGHHRERKI